MPALSPRETETIQYLANGMSYKQIACAMGISVDCVRAYVSRSKRKLQTENAIATVAAAAYLRLVVVVTVFGNMTTAS